MTLREEIIPYLDGNVLVAPSPQPSPRQIGVRGSDNGVLHTSRYLLLLKQNNEPMDFISAGRIQDCIDKDGILQRAPGMDEGNAPDDHYGYFSVMIALGLSGPKVKLLLKHMHPMLIYMRALYNGGLQSLIARLFSPLMAVIVALSNMRTPSFPTEDTSDRLLTWNIIEGLRDKSVLINLAGKIWRARQRQIYGDNPSAEIFYRYYSEGIMHKYVRE